jgi:hypothetical protein
MEGEGWLEEDSTGRQQHGLQRGQLKEKRLLTPCGVGGWGQQTAWKEASESESERASDREVCLLLIPSYVRP